MKSITLLFSFLLISTILHGQEIKISVAPTLSAALFSPSVVGSPSQNPKAGFSSSIDYLFQSEKRINFGLGFCYQLSQVQFVPNLNSGNLSLHTEKANLLSISLRSLYHIKKDFYFSLDPTVDFHLNYYLGQTLDKQTGIGLSFAFGKNVKINEIILLNIEPRLWIHNILPFQDENNRSYLTTAGLNMGLVFTNKKDHVIDK